MRDSIAEGDDPNKDKQKIAQYTPEAAVSPCGPSTGLEMVSPGRRQQIQVHVNPTDQSTINALLLKGEKDHTRSKENK